MRFKKVEERERDEDALGKSEHEKQQQCRYFAASTPSRGLFARSPRPSPTTWTDHLLGIGEWQVTRRKWNRKFLRMLVVSAFFPAVHNFGKDIFRSVVLYVCILFWKILSMLIKKSCCFIQIMKYIIKILLLYYYIIF